MPITNMWFSVIFITFFHSWSLREPSRSGFSGEAMISRLSFARIPKVGTAALGAVGLCFVTMLCTILPELKRLEPAQ